MPDDDETPMVYDNAEEAVTVTVGEAETMSGGVMAHADTDRPTAQQLDEREARMSGARRPMGPIDGDPARADDDDEPTHPDEI